MRQIAIAASFIAIVLAGVWVYLRPSYESWIALAASIAAFASSFFLKRESNAVGQSQRITDGSVGVQAGRDANIRDIRGK